MNISEIPAWESLADEPMDSVDAEILARTAVLYERLDPVPADLVDQLRFAISLEALEFELAVLVVDADRLLSVRTEQTSTVQTLTFTCDALTIMVNVGSEGPGHKRIDGWLAPGSAGRVELHQSNRVLTADADPDGRFAFPTVEPGLTRFVVRLAPEDRHAPVATTMVEI
ncbi:MAG TPA: hypothetical protein VMB79_01545 [Jatrophihabitans sp.]|nr:hypothetical protein [Jatrophihabitans sp.]